MYTWYGVLRKYIYIYNIFSSNNPQRLMSIPRRVSIADSLTKGLMRMVGLAGALCLGLPNTSPDTLIAHVTLIILTCHISTSGTSITIRHEV